VLAEIPEFFIIFVNFAIAVLPKVTLLLISSWM
jgi:hypothetical protein